LAYGDAALNAGGRVIAMNRLNRMLAFDTENGLITCEAGVTLGESSTSACRAVGFSRSRRARLAPPRPAV